MGERLVFLEKRSTWILPPWLIHRGSLEAEKSLWVAIIRVDETPPFIMRVHLFRPLNLWKLIKEQSFLPMLSTRGTAAPSSSGLIMKPSLEQQFPCAAAHREEMVASRKSPGNKISDSVEVWILNLPWELQASCFLTPALSTFTMATTQRTVRYLPLISPGGKTIPGLAPV